MVREGWLHKRGNNRIWAKRYFVLTKHALCYYNKPPTSTSGAAGLGDLGEQISEMSEAASCRPGGSDPNPNPDPDPDPDPTPGPDPDQP